MGRERTVAFTAICAAIFCASSPARADIVTTGSVTPDPHTSTSSTSLTVGNTADGTMIVNGGSVVTAGSGLIAEKAGVSGTVTVTDSGSTWTNSGLLSVGDKATGALNITNGGKVSSQSGYIDFAPGATGTVTVDGAGSVWTSRFLGVGQYGTGTLKISKGGAVNVTSQTFVGSNGGPGTIQFDNGTLTTGSLFAGVDQLTGTGVINAQGLITDTDLLFDQTHGLQQTFTFNAQAGQNITIHLQADGSVEMGAGYRGNGSLTIQGGSAVNSTVGYLGYQSGSVGAARVEGAGSAWTTSRDLFVGYFGRGTLMISGGGQVNSHGASIGNNNPAGLGVATVDGAGSVWTDTGDFFVGSGGDGTLHIINGGVVNVSGMIFLGRNGGPGVLHLDHGTLNTASLLANPGGLTGTGVINTHGFVSDMDLVFDQTHGAQQQLILNTLAGQNVTINLNADGAGSLGAGYQGQGSMTVRGGVAVRSAFSYVAYQKGSVGVVTVDGAGSNWDAGTMGVGIFGNGTLKIINGGRVSSGQTVIGTQIWPGSTGLVIVDGPGSTWDASHGEVRVGNLSTGALHITNGGSVTCSLGFIGYNASTVGEASIGGAGSTWSNGTLTVGYAGTGTLNIGDGGWVKIADFGLAIATVRNSHGTVNLAGGTLDLQGRNITKGAGSAMFNFTGGRVQNVGTFGMDLDQQGGTLAAGASPGKTIIAGNYTLESAGLLEVELARAGTVAGTDFDFYSVTGSARLMGMVSVLDFGGFVPLAGGTFDVLTAQSIDATGLRINEGFDFAVISGGNGQVLRVTAVPEPGTVGMLSVGGVLLLRRRRVLGKGGNF